MTFDALPADVRALFNAALLFGAINPDLFAVNVVKAVRTFNGLEVVS